jgi:hypothetical protein
MLLSLVTTRIGYIQHGRKANERQHRRGTEETMKTHTPRDATGTQRGTGLCHCCWRLGALCRQWDRAAGLLSAARLLRTVTGNPTAVRSRSRGRVVPQPGWKPAFRSPAVAARA